MLPFKDQDCPWYAASFLRFVAFVTHINNFPLLYLEACDIDDPHFGPSR